MFEERTSQLLKMPSRLKAPDSQLRTLVRRLLRTNRPDSDIPVIIATMEGEHCNAVGRLLDRGGARVSALVDTPLERERPVTVFLPENAYIGEVVSCVSDGEHFTVELLLIQYHED
jgi:hypothetical protein